MIRDGMTESYLSRLYYKPSSIDSTESYFRAARNQDSNAIDPHTPYMNQSYCFPKQLISDFVTVK